jgi:phospholipase/carboxylesterase
MLHGLGSNGNDLIGLSRALADDLPNTAFYAPDAPDPFEGGPTGFQWYSRSSPEARVAGVRQVAPLVDAFVDDLLEKHELAPSRCILLGFSQGCIVSLHTAPRRQRPLAGVVGFSGAMVSGETLADELANRTPILLVHGADDTVLPSERTEEARQVLSSLDVPNEVHILPGLPHSIDQRGVQLAADFMRRQFA